MHACQGARSGSCLGSLLEGLWTIQSIGPVLTLAFVKFQLSQMLVDDIGDVTTTNDGATILKLLEVEHPAAKVRMAPVVAG